MANLSKFKNNKSDLTKIGNKAFYTIMQHIENFRNEDYFLYQIQFNRMLQNINCIKAAIKNKHYNCL